MDIFEELKNYIKNNCLIYLRSHTDVNDTLMQLIQNGPQWKNKGFFNSGVVKPEITF